MNAARSFRVTAIFMASLMTATPVLAQGMPASAPVVGDLTHLTFTATGPLDATLLAPASGTAVTGVSALFDVGTVIGAGVELSINDEIISYAKIGKRVNDTRTGRTEYTYYGVPLRGGPNRVRLTPLGANRLRGTSTEYTVYGPGAAIALRTSIIGTLKADGVSRGIVRVATTDAWGHPAAAGSRLRVTIAAGDAHFVLRQNAAIPHAASTETENAQAPPRAAVTEQNLSALGETDAASQSIEFALGDGGAVELPLAAGLRASEVIVQAAIGELVSDAHAFIAPNVRQPIVTGIVTTGIGSVPGVPGQEPTAVDGANSRRGRIAVYASGAITKQALATVAYDTAHTLDTSHGNSSFSEDPNSRIYPIYGDASTRRNDALSRDRLYARIDVGRSNFMWGEFQPNTSDSAGLGGYNLLVSGARLELASKSAKLMLFNAANNVAYARTVLSPTGLAEIATPLHPNIIVGSDVVTLVGIDRRTGAILSQAVMTRNFDYTIDYGSGVIRFINIPLPYDANFNPQQIAIQYQYDGVGIKAETTGGRFDVQFGANTSLHAGAGYVNDSTGPVNVSLFGQDIGGLLPGGSWQIAHLTSSGHLTNAQNFGLLPGSLPGTALANIPQRGDAYRVSVNTTHKADRLSAHYEATSLGFDNPFGGLSTPGLVDYAFGWTHKLGDRGELSFGYDHQQSAVAAGSGTSSQSDASLRYRQKVGKKITFSLGVDRRSANYGASSATSTVAAPGLPNSPSAPAAVAVTSPNGTGVATQASIGVKYEASRAVTIAVDRTQTLGGASAATLSQPTQTTAQASVALGRSGHAYVRQLWSASPTQSFATATSAFTGAGNSTRSTSFGFERRIGTRTSLDSQYVLNHGSSESDTYAAIGVRQHLDFSNLLKGDVTLQRARATGSGALGFTVYGASLAYTTSRVKATGSYEMRTGSGGGRTFALGAAGALSDDLSILASINDVHAFGAADDKVRIGLAYRPSRNDRSAFLFGYEREDGNGVIAGVHTNTVAAEGLFRPSTRTELAARYALKLDGDAYYTAHTSLIGMRATQHIGRTFDIAAEGRWLSAHIANVGTTGFALEGGARLGNSMRLAAGYNFTGSPDPMLATAPTRRGLYLTVTSVVQNIFGWGK